MENVWVMAAVWVGLALIATLVAIWFRISTALSEIVVGTAAQLVIGALFVHAELGGKTNWISFLAGTGAIVLTFLAGAELDPQIFRSKWKEATAVGLVGFFGPFLGCTAVAHYILHWSGRSSWLAGVALSTTSVAVVYAVMLELGFNVTDFGKAVLAACFVNDLGTVIALGMIFSPFTIKTLIFVVVSVVVFTILPFLTPRFFKKYGGRVSELEAKYILFLLFAMAGLAVWSGSEAVLPAYIIGMVLAGTVGKDHSLIRRLRTLTFGLLTPFYFIRAGSFVSVSPLIAAPLVFAALFFAKMLSKVIPLYPHGEGIRLQEGRRTVLHADDVYRPDVWNHFRAVRAESRCHHPGTVFVFGRHGDRECRDPHYDR
jgi:glutathione-regulated potassium-efflux system ancillary protein KefC